MKRSGLGPGRFNRTSWRIKSTCCLGTAALLLLRAALGCLCSCGYRVLLRPSNDEVMKYIELRAILTNSIRCPLWKGGLPTPAPVSTPTLPGPPPAPQPRASFPAPVESPQPRSRADSPKPRSSPRSPAHEWQRAIQRISGKAIGVGCYDDSIYSLSGTPLAKAPLE